MDFPIKNPKGYEMEAIEELNKHAPEIYRGKNQGFYWALHQAARVSRTSKIDWKEVAAFRLEKHFDGSGFEEKDLLVLFHLTGEEDDYNEVWPEIKSQFELIKVRKAFFARNIIKWGIMQLRNSAPIKESETKSQIVLDDSEESPIKIIEELCKLIERSRTNPESRQTLSQINQLIKSDGKN